MSGQARSALAKALRAGVSARMSGCVSVWVSGVCEWCAHVWKCDWFHGCMWVHGWWVEDERMSG
jgi:hypothetical protein